MMTTVDNNKNTRLQFVDTPIHLCESSSAFCKTNMHLHKPKDVVEIAKHTAIYGVS